MRCFFLCFTKTTAYRRYAYCLVYPLGIPLCDLDCFAIGHVPQPLEVLLQQELQIINMDANSKQLIDEKKCWITPLVLSVVCPAEWAEDTLFEMCFIVVV